MDYTTQVNISTVLTFDWKNLPARELKRGENERYHCTECVTGTECSPSNTETFVKYMSTDFS